MWLRQLKVYYFDNKSRDTFDMEKTREIEQYLRWKFKLRVLEFAKDYGKVKETCEMFNVSRSSYFNWKRKFDKHGAKGLLRKRGKLIPTPIESIRKRLIWYWTLEGNTNLAHGVSNGTWKDTMTSIFLNQVFIGPLKETVSNRSNEQLPEKRWDLNVTPRKLRDTMSKWMLNSWFSTPTKEKR